MFKEQVLFPPKPERVPKIYAYSDSRFPGQLKIGMTGRDSVIDRIKEQFPIDLPGVSWKLEWFDVALRPDGTSFRDHDVQEFLGKEGFKQTATEWYACGVNDVKHAFVCVKNREEYEAERTLDFAMRPEQEAAVRKTKEYFDKIDAEGRGEIPHFLWNAKMRFGKTFTAYELAKRMGAKRVLVLTFKPAVEDSWHDDLVYHKDFDGWQFYSSRSKEDPEKLDKKRPIVCFGSFQDYLGKNDSGGIKAKNEWVHAMPWDLIILDEYHYGAWNDNAKSLLESGDEEAKKAIDEQNEILKDDGYNVDLGQRFDETTMPITGSHYLYLSGTPFRALSSGEFLEDQIFNWTYQDEQEQKEKHHADPDSPYEELPTMVLMTYQMPDDLGHLIENYNMDEFDLNEFFRATGSGKEAKFLHENAVQKWLDILRGKANIFNSDSPLNKRPPLPFDDTRLLNLCCNTMWFMNNVSSCDAMFNMLHEPVNSFYQGYTILNCSGPEAGIGLDALAPVREAMSEPMKAKTIILTCGKLTTGVTIRPLGGILMLRNCSSPETYFQSAFRVQSPWSIENDDTKTKEIIKKTCYVFDFAPNRALREIVSYANKLTVNPRHSSEEKIQEFINFLPILQYDGSSMRQMDAREILDFVDNGTTATLLARRWNSPTLVNVDNGTLNRVLADPKAMEAIMKIEGFRALGKDIIETIVNKAKQIKDLKKKDHLTPKQKKQLTEEEKEYISKRKLVQEKLMKFATRIPIFMYLTDYREEALKDIIEKIEPNLFEKVTGLTIEDFELLVSLGVFNDAYMNDAILKFRHYEDNSLIYTGINKHEGDTRVGAWDTSVWKEDTIIERK
jgi:hypothetical protein